MRITLSLTIWKKIVFCQDESCIRGVDFCFFNRKEWKIFVGLLEITNPTDYDAEVMIFAENEVKAARPLGDNAFLQRDRKV